MLQKWKEKWYSLPPKRRRYTRNAICILLVILLALLVYVKFPPVIADTVTIKYTSNLEDYYSKYPTSGEKAVSTKDKKLVRELVGMLHEVKWHAKNADQTIYGDSFYILEYRVGYWHKQTLILSPDMIYTSYKYMHSCYLYGDEPKEHELYPRAAEIMEQLLAEKSIKM